MTHVKRTTDRDDYETPKELFRPLDALYSFDLDAAASAANALCESYFSLEEGSWDGSNTSWRFEKPMAIWCNPPFSKKEKFIAQAIKYRNFNRVTCLLLPANAPETHWWRYMVFRKADQIIYLTPRVNFNLNGKPVKGVPFPSCLVLYYPELAEVAYFNPSFSYWDWKKE